MNLHWLGPEEIAHDARSSEQIDVVDESACLIGNPVT